MGVQFTAELVHQLLSGDVLSEVLRGGHGQPYKEEASIYTWIVLCGFPCPSSGCGIHRGLR